MGGGGEEREGGRGQGRTGRGSKRSDENRSGVRRRGSAGSHTVHDCMFNMSWEYSLIPRLLPSLLSHTVCEKKLGRSLGCVRVAGMSCNQIWLISGSAVSTKFG